jgi:hypothetical protein
VPSAKVVVGITSYGRSFAMADGNCYGPDCAFTGTSTQSNAQQGPCTQVAGYIADAEIKDILNSPGRINQNFVDPASNSRILVWDTTQWVAFMDDAIRAERSSLYAGLQLGGTSNWAVDLEAYHDPPENIASWTDFVVKIQAGGDPYQEGTRSGNWTSLSCDTDAAAQESIDLPPEVRWAELDCSDAWHDMITVYEVDDKPNKKNFTRSLANTMRGPGGNPSECDGGWEIQSCKDVEGGGSGPASFVIWNSFYQINKVRKREREREKNKSHQNLTRFVLTATATSYTAISTKTS